MPYLSPNHRYTKQSRSRRVVDSTLFVFFSIAALFGVLFFFGWLSHGDNSQNFGYQIHNDAEFLAQKR